MPVRSAWPLLHLHLDGVVLDRDREGLDGNVRGQRQRLAGVQVEARPVPRALDRAVVLVELALDERAVVVRAAVLDREDLAVAVEDPDLEVLPLDQPHPARRELGDAADVDDLGHPGQRSGHQSPSPARLPPSTYSASSHCAAAPRLALLSTFSASSAHFIRVAEMSIPSSSSTNSRSRRRSSSGVMPLISSDTIEADAWLIAHPWPEKRTASIRPSSPVRSWTRSSSPQSGFVSSNSRSASSSSPKLCGCL